MKGGLIATSVDGEVFEGTYDYKRGIERGTTRLTLYHAKGGAVVLLGEWREGYEVGDWMFQLMAEKPTPHRPAAKLPAAKRKYGKK